MKPVRLDSKYLGNHPTCGEAFGPAGLNVTSASNAPLRLPFVDPRVKPNLNYHLGTLGHSWPYNFINNMSRPG